MKRKNKRNISHPVSKKSRPEIETEKESKSVQTTPSNIVNSSNQINFLSNFLKVKNILINEKLSFVAKSSSRNTDTLRAIEIIQSIKKEAEEIEAMIIEANATETYIWPDSVDLLAKIFQFLPWKDTFTLLARVSKMFLEASKHPVAITHVEFYQFQTDKLVEIFEDIIIFLVVASSPTPIP